MKQKGSAKSVTKPNFWGKHKEKVSKELENFIFNQYYSEDTLSVYCDMSMIRGKPLMSVACSYVSNSSVYVKHQLLHTTREVIDKNIYAELKSLAFALSNFHKYVKGCKNVDIFTDIINIKELLKGEATFQKNPNIEVVRKDLVNLYRSKINEHPNVDIKIYALYPEYKNFNPFHKSSHNSARELLRN
ncbi:hypothetical protein MZM54_03600 [[Brevibacterium] frigoritolerans]|nr:hypothetical protein [Peribacillus frigoritolerans]